MSNVKLNPSLPIVEFDEITQSLPIFVTPWILTLLRIFELSPIETSFPM